MHQKPWLKILTIIICLFLAVNLCACGKKIPEITENPRPGWIAIKGEGVALFLPQGFVGGNPGRDLEKIKAQLKAIDPNYEQRLLGITQNPTAVALLAFDTQGFNNLGSKNQNNQNQDSISNISVPTNINITSQAMPKDATLSSLMDISSQQIAKWYQISEQKIIAVNQKEVAKIVATISNGNPTIKQLFYLVPNTNQKKFWIVTYTTLGKDFDRLLPMFTDSIKTLQFLR
jgi:hypothetical protein